MPHPHGTPDNEEIEDAQTDDGIISRDAIDTPDSDGELSERFETLESDVQKIREEMIHPAAVRIVLKEYGIGADAVDEILEDIEAVDESHRQRQSDGGEADV